MCKFLLHLIIIICCIIISNLSFSQEVEFIKKIPLENALRESSGLLYCNSGFISHNDSGGKPELYIIDSTNGKIKNTIVIENATNRDWEDIACDSTYIYIGDFGNNSGSRTDLRIYKCQKPNNWLQKSEQPLINTFYFNFEDQVDFDKNFRETPYDCEAFFVVNNTAYIFTKNWKDQTTSLYKLPLDGKTKTAKLLSVLNVDCLITGADFNKNKNTIVCCGYKKGFPIKPVIVLIGFNPENGSISYLKRHYLKYYDHQTEGVVWVNNNTVCISNESYTVIPPKIAWLNISGVNKLSISNLNSVYHLILPDKFVGKYIIKNSKNDIIQYSKIKRKNNIIVIDMPNDADTLLIQGKTTTAWFKID